jgi:hypothetical protein
MKWVLCGLTFALSVVLAVATVSIRAGNTRLRLELAREFRSIEARRMEVGRLSLQTAEHATPERLCDRLRELLRAGGVVKTQESSSWQ